MPLISIITVNYNNSQVTEELLASIPTENSRIELEILVVDNGSIPNPVPAWEVKYPHVIFVRSEVNLGFSKGNNLAIHKAKGELLFLVNNDTIFTDRLLALMFEAFSENPRLGIASPKIYYFQEERVIQYVGFTPMNFYTGRNQCIGQFEPDLGQYDDRPHPTGYVHGAAMMVRREVVEEVGPMPESFFLYYEEMDWCEKIRAAGYEVGVVPSAIIFHKESVSVGKSSALKEYYMNRNRILFIRRNALWYQRIIFYLFFSVIVVPRNVLAYLRRGQAKFIAVLFRAILWNLRSPAN